MILKKISLWLQVLLYTGAGINHFINPTSYIPMIPPYIPWKPEVNIVVGIIEILLGISLLFLVKKRKVVAVCIIVFLVLMLPAHIYHIQMGGVLPGSLTLPLWGAWIRIILQFPAMLWAWSARK